MCCVAGVAQNFPYTHYTTKDGLVNSSVYCCFQDHNGFMWFGTENGVSRFDGSIFRNYTVADGLPGNIIMSITEDENNNLYVGTKSQGIAVLVNDTFNTVLNDSNALQANVFLRVHNTMAYSLSLGSGFAIDNIKERKIQSYVKELSKNGISTKYDVPLN